VQDHG
ncbi:hypothetical protein MK382_05325, partial [Streptococcus pneumoniae]